MSFHSTSDIESCDVKEILQKQIGLLKKYVCYHIEMLVSAHRCQLPSKGFRIIPIRSKYYWRDTVSLTQRRRWTRPTRLATVDKVPSCVRHGVK